MFAAFVAAGLLSQGTASAYVDYASVDPNRTFSDVELKLDSAIEKIQPEAIQKWPDTFAGAWLGPDGLGDEVHIAFTSGAEEKVAELARDFPAPNLLVAEAATTSLAELEKAQDEMIDARDAIANGAERRQGLTRDDYTLDIDVEGNSVIIMSPGDVPMAQRQEVREKSGVPVRFYEGAEPPADISCVGRENCDPLRGGLHVVFYNNQISNNCSSGFIAQKNGVKQLLSAGHCDENSNGVFQSATGFHFLDDFGPVAEAYDSQRVDALRAPVTLGGYSARGWWYQNSDTKVRTVTGVNSYDALMIGTPVGKSGYSTATTWGNITSKYLSAPGFQDLISASVDAAGGDSGSGLVKQANIAAVGIAKGIILSGPPELVGDSVYSHVEFVENRLGVNIITNDYP